MGTPLGPKYIPYAYMDPLGGEDNYYQKGVTCWDSRTSLPGILSFSPGEQEVSRP